MDHLSLGIAPHFEHLINSPTVIQFSEPHSEQTTISLIIFSPSFESTQLEHLTETNQP